MADTNAPSRPLRVCLIGPSGAGKSTLAKTLARRRPDIAARVPVDYFFTPRSPEDTLADFLRRPLAYDWETLDRALASTDGSAGQVQSATAGPSGASHSPEASSTRQLRSTTTCDA